MLDGVLQFGAECILCDFAYLIGLDEWDALASSVCWWC
jgi:hypothetical protein